MNATKNKAGPGMRVEIELLSHAGENECMSFVIVPEESADYARGFLSEATPLAKTIVGHAEGETLPYQRAELYAVRILSVAPSVDTPLDELADERQANYAKAVRQAERANAVSFASSFSGKWGDYDPESLPEDPQ